MSTELETPRSRRRGRLGLLAVLVVGASLLTWANLSRGGPAVPQHPENPREQGSRALAQVLEAEGVEVTVVTTDAALSRTSVEKGTTLLVTSTGELGTSTYASVREARQRAGATVLVSPTQLALDELRVGARVGSATGGTTEAGCDLELARDLSLDGSGPTYEPLGAPVSVDHDTCFTTGSGAELPGLLLRIGSTFALGAADTMTNDRIDEADNAALLLRLLGSNPRLVWYVADADDLDVTDTRADSAALSALLPGWLVPALILVGAGLAALLLWRGRRFGPLVVEPLPVTVPADETEASRGRLYRAAKDPQHAADALRADARARWRERLGLSPGTTHADLAVQVHSRLRSTEAHASLTQEEVAGLLHDGPVPDDRSLVALAARLHDLLPAPTAETDTSPTERKDPR